jgi:hypothetical protein
MNAERRDEDRIRETLIYRHLDALHNMHLAMMQIYTDENVRELYQYVHEHHLRTALRTSVLVISLTPFAHHILEGPIQEELFHTAMHIVENVTDSADHHPDLSTMEAFLDWFNRLSTETSRDFRERHIYWMTMEQMQAHIELLDINRTSIRVYKRLINELLHEYKLLCSCGPLTGWHRKVGVAQPPRGRPEIVIYKEYDPDSIMPQTQGSMSTSPLVSGVATGIGFVAGAAIGSIAPVTTVVGLLGLCAWAKWYGTPVYVEHVLMHRPIRDIARESEHWREGILEDFVVEESCTWRPEGVKVQRFL